MTTLAILVPGNVRQRLRSGESDSHRQLLADQANTYGIDIAVVGPEDVDFGSATARLMVPTPRGWRETAAPIPTLYSNQLSRPSAAEARLLRELNGQADTLVFNETNRLRLQSAFEMLSSLPATAGLIRPNRVIDPGELAGKYGLYLISSRKPRPNELIVDYSVARIRCLNPRESAAATVSSDQLANVTPTASGPIWAIQLPGWPVEIGGPVEWRFYVQRGRSGEWETAAAVVKREASSRASAAAWQLGEALESVYGAAGRPLEERLTKSARSVAEGLARYLPGLAHCAVDFWLGQDGNPWLKAVTGLPDPSWLQLAGDHEGLRRVVDHPVVFARVLSTKGVGKLNVDFGRTS